jgi:hypothetical protein
MHTLRFNRWTRRRPKPNVQMYETAPYETQVIDVQFDTAEAERQLQHANQQLELQSQYPGRQRQRKRANVITLAKLRGP